MLPYSDKDVTKSRKSRKKAGRTEYLDGKGKMVGYSKPSPTRSGETVYYDSRGRKVGKSALSHGRTVYYDEKGRVSGSSRKDASTGSSEFRGKKGDLRFTEHRDPGRDARATYYKRVTGGRSDASGCLTGMLMTVGVLSGALLMIFR